jgi:hypothetical protein
LSTLPPHSRNPSFPTPTIHNNRKYAPLHCSSRVLNVCLDGHGQCLWH